MNNRGLREEPTSVTPIFYFWSPRKAEAPEDGGCGGENVGKRQET